MSLAAQQQRIEDWYEQRIEYSNAVYPQAMWERQTRWQRVDNNKQRYFQGLPTHNLDDYPYHTETVDDDKQMQRLHDTPNYQDWSWVQLWPELAQEIFPANMWCDQFVSAQTFGYQVYLQFQYNGRDVQETIQRKHYIYTIDGRRFESGWYFPTDAEIVSLWSEQTETQYGYRTQPDMGRVAHWRWYQTNLIELFHHPTNGVTLTLSGTHAADFFDRITIDDDLILLSSDAEVNALQQRRGRRILSTSTQWVWRTLNPFGDETLHEVRIA